MKDDLQSTIAEAAEISIGSTFAWATMIGTWILRPAPIPVRAWYPIQCDDGLPMSRVNSRPVPMVERIDPMIMRGT